MNMKMKSMLFLFLLPMARAAIRCNLESPASTDFCETSRICVIDSSEEDSEEDQVDLGDCECRLKIDRYDVDTPELTLADVRRSCNDRRDFLRELVIIGGDFQTIDTHIFSVYSNLSKIVIRENKFDMRCLLSRIGVSHITDLDISHNDIRTIIDSAVANLESVVKFKASYNSITDTGCSFKYLLALEELYLNNNLLKSISRNEFSDLPKLRILDLSHNSLIDIQSDMNLPGLQVLYLSYNNLSRINNKQNANFPSLHTLEIGSNNFRGFGSSYSFGNLEKLDANDNKIGELDPKFLEKLKQLKHFNVSLNDFSKVDKRYFENLKLLESVDFTNNKIKLFAGKSSASNLKELYLGQNLLNDEGIACENLPKMENLNVIDLSYNELMTIKNCTFQDMPSLLDIRMQSNSINHIQPDSFRSQQKLEKLKLSNNDIHKIYKRDLSGLTGVHELDLRGNNIESLEIGAFDALPSSTKVLIIVKNQDKSCAFDSNKLSIEMYNFCLSGEKPYTFITTTNIIIGCSLLLLVSIIAVTTCVMAKYCCKKRQCINILMPEIGKNPNEIIK